MSASRPHQDDWEVSSPERLDEAFAQLRALPASALVWCVVGPVPMVLGLLFFWSDLTRGGQTALSASVWAMLLAGGYAWLKMSQAFFARAVWARLLPEGGLPVLTVGEWFRRTGALLAVAAVSVPVQALAGLTVLPFAWVFGFFHHATALAYTHDLGPRPLRALARTSVRLTHHELLAQHLSLLILVVLGVLVWASVFALGLLLPYLLKILAGVESEFTRSPLAVGLSSLYFCVTLSVSWMILSPYFRVVYVLRAFHAMSRHTGDDVLGRLQAARARAAGVLALWVVMAVLGGGAAAEEEAPAGASGIPPVAVAPVHEADPAELSQAIRATLSERDYQWRLPGEAEGTPEASKTGLLASLKGALTSVRDALRELDRLLTEVGRTVRRLLGAKPQGSPSEGAGRSALDGNALRGILYAVAGLVVIGGLVLMLRAWRRRQRPVVTTMAGAPMAAPVDLTDEATLASALPEDEWLRMARAQSEGGDLRLAVRAVFLATLAALGEQRLIDIARSKSNRDYAVELRLRAAVRREVPEVFGRSVSVFERAWYGLHEVAPEWVQELLENHQRLTSRVPTT
jgi:hypothetical protein